MYLDFNNNELNDNIPNDQICPCQACWFTCANNCTGSCSGGCSGTCEDNSCNAPRCYFFSMF
ncbi:hypothetical protein CG710_001535 [Lachnotalea glycerini]|uniref:Uncharacterized protein n=1 Tax=Lachnotalea glycerini TaxID=1763509 RepID=A0A371JKH5_9FIRM|nr:hypothetical protein CG710_001535 [Lachnotalea glycerini]